MFRTCVNSKIVVRISDQHVIEISMYHNIFLLLDSNLAMINVPMGIEKSIGVSAASPTNP